MLKEYYPQPFDIINLRPACLINHDIMIVTLHDAIQYSKELIAMKNQSTDMMSTIWKEVQKIDWRNINREALKTFLFVIIGDDSTFRNVTDSLETTTYDFMNIKHQRKIPLSDDAQTFMVNVPIEAEIESGNIMRNADIIVVDQKYYAHLHHKYDNLYTFSTGKEISTFEKIVAENEHLKQALCYNFPAFRSLVARETMVQVSKQNAAWAGGTSIPNIAPGVHSLFYAPVEMTSDFSVMTLNELRMTFILASICGRKVNPFRLVPEILIMLGGAKGAQMLATQLLGKVPAGAGTLLKAGVAFAFTYAIGEAVFVNMNYGITFNKTDLMHRVEELKGFGQDMAKNVVSRIKKTDGHQ